MKTKAFPLIILALIFVTASSCGDDGANHNKNLEIAALRTRLQQLGTATTTNTVTISNTTTQTVSNTMTVTQIQTATVTNSNSATSSGTSTRL